MHSFKARLNSKELIKYSILKLSTIVKYGNFKKLEENGVMIMK